MQVDELFHIQEAIKSGAVAGVAEVAPPQQVITVQALDNDEITSALTRLSESIWPDSTSGSPVDPNYKAKNAAAALYNSHNVAAHRSSIVAYNSGSAADHQVAAVHHQAAADAAGAAQKMHIKDSHTYNDYATAAKYHNSQAKAHTDGSKNAAAGNSVSRYEFAVPGQNY